MTHAEMILRYCPWVAELQSFLGRAETPGPATAPFIARWLRKLHTPWTDDETPWCGVAMAGVLDACSLPYPRMYYRARKWVGFGIPLATGKTEVAKYIRTAPYGAVCVLDRPPREGDGHVGIYCGRAERSDGPIINLLAGNQGNAVTYATFPQSRVIYLGWPDKLPPRAIFHVLNAKALGITTMPPASGGEA